MTSKCGVDWCVVQPADGDGLCAIHRQHPVLDHRETAEQWRKRLAAAERSRQALARAAENRAAAQA